MLCPPSRHTSTRFALALTAVLLLASACASKTPDSYDNVSKPSVGTGPVGNGASSTTTPAAYTATYENDPNCKVEDLPRRDERDPGKTPPVQCGYLVVPENRSNPSGTKLRLQVVRIRATGPTPRPDPYVYLEGGPGGSALSGIGFLWRAFAGLSEDRDLIIMDQRGTGYSEPKISCDYDYSRATSNDEYVDILKRCHDRLTESKFKLESYTTKENAADFADLRKALEIPEWNLFGVSYGTRLALQIMADHPEGVRSVVIDSVFPGGVNFFAEYPANGVRALQAVFAACAADGACNSANPDLENGLVKIINDLNKSPIQDNSPFSMETSTLLKFNGDTFLRVVFQLMYSTDAIYILPALITDGRKDAKNAVRDVLLRAPLPGMSPRGADRSHDFSSGFYYTVQCAEFGQEQDQAAIEALVAPVNPVIRDSFVRNALEDYRVCKDWNVPPSPVAEPTADIPTLALAGSFDPITPPSWAQRAKNLLPKSRYVEVEGSGHGVYFVGDCEGKIVKAFLNDPIVEVGKTDGCPKVTKFLTSFRR